MQHLMFLQNVKREKMKKHPSSKHGPTLSDFGVLCSNIHEYVFFIYNICKKNTKIQLGKYYLDLTNKELDNEQFF